MPTISRPQVRRIARSILVSGIGFEVPKIVGFLGFSGSVITVTMIYGLVWPCLFQRWESYGENRKKIKGWFGELFFFFFSFLKTKEKKEIFVCGKWESSSFLEEWVGGAASLLGS